MSCLYTLGWLHRQRDRNSIKNLCGSGRIYVVVEASLKMRESLWKLEHHFSEAFCVDRTITLGEAFCVGGSICGREDISVMFLPWYILICFRHIKIMWVMINKKKSRNTYQQIESCILFHIFINIVCIHHYSWAN